MSNSVDLLSRPVKFTPEEIPVITNFIAKYFIARNDVKALQRKEPLGAYKPINKPWTRKDFEDHFMGKVTFGHYILDTNSMCKIFAFDIDLKKTGKVPTVPLPADSSGVGEWLASFKEVNLRETWLDRRHPSRTWIKMSMREMAARIASGCAELEVPHITSYTGAKGLHVYGLIGHSDAYEGRAPGADAYIAARAVLDACGNFEPSKGNVFFQWADRLDLEKSIFEIEVFPKQTESGPDSYGNLLRLPYGVNLKSPNDSTFFIDETLPMGRIEPATWGQIFSTIS